jgi:hypothetical protein
MKNNDQARLPQPGRAQCFQLNGPSRENRAAHPNSTGAFASCGRHRSPPETNIENRSPAVLLFDFLRVLRGANPFNSNRCLTLPPHRDILPATSLHV